MIFVTVNLELDQLQQNSLSQDEEDVLEELRQADLPEYGLTQGYTGHLDVRKLDVRAIKVEAADSEDHVRLSVANVTVGTQRGEGETVELPSGRVVNFYIEAI